MSCFRKCPDALSEGKDDYAVSLFRQAANAGEDRTENVLLDQCGQEQ